MKQQKLSLSHRMDVVQRYFTHTFRYGTATWRSIPALGLERMWPLIAKANNTRRIYPTLNNPENRSPVRLNMTHVAVGIMLSNLPYAGNGTGIFNRIVRTRDIERRFMDINSKVRALPFAADITPTSHIGQIT